MNRREVEEALRKEGKLTKQENLVDALKKEGKLTPVQEWKAEGQGREAF